MKTVSLSSVHAASFRVCCLLVQFVPAAAFADVPAPAAATPAAAPKTHVLFMGADINVGKEKEYHLVEDVTPTDLIIKPGGTTVKMPLSVATDLFIRESLKVTQTTIEIGHLKAERAYSINADPFIELEKATSFAAGESQLADIANSNALMARMLGGAGFDATTGTTANTGAAGAEQQALQLQNTRTAEAFDVGSQSVKAWNAASEQMYDAIRLTFEVSAKTDLGHPYYAVIALIRDRDSKPGQVRKWAYVRSLGSMAAGETRKVLVYRAGMPPGYILESSEVHIYNGKEELATNLSRKRLPLTDEEALDFRIIEYVGANKGRTVAAMPATGLTSAVRATLTPAQLGETCYVRVNKAGRIAAAFRDAEGKKPLNDPALESALKSLRFKPALQAGKPVDALSPVKLSQLDSS